MGAPGYAKVTGLAVRYTPIGSLPTPMLAD